MAPENEEHILNASFFLEEHRHVFDSMRSEGLELGPLLTLDRTYRDAEVRFGPVLRGICPNREPEPNVRESRGRTANRTSRTARFRFERGSNFAEPPIFFSSRKQ